MRKHGNRIILFFALLICGVINAQVDGDYRTAGTGNWNDVSTWQTRVASNWVAASAVPTSTNNVYIQSTHIITIDIATAECNELSLNVNIGGNNGRIVIGSNVLQVYGKHRNYNTTLGTNTTLGVDGTFYSDQGVSTNYQTTAISSTAGVGLIRYVGNTRTLFVTGEMGAGGTNNVDVDFALTTGQTATLETAFKGRNITFSSGNYVLTSSSGIRPDGGSAGTGTLVISSGVTLELASSVSIQRIAADGASAHCASITLATGATLQYTGAPSTIGTSTITFNGTVWYSSNSSQTLVTVGGNTGSALPNVYTNLTFNPGTKTLAYNTTVNGTLSMRTSASSIPILGLGSFTLTYGSGATLQYRGIGSPPAAQTTADAEWPTAGSSLSMPPNVDVFTITTLSLNNNKAISGDLRMSGALGVNTKLDLGINNLTVATITRQNPDVNKYVVTSNTGVLTIRNVGSTNVLFPVGPTTTLYHPVTMQNTGTVDDYSVRVVSTDAACLTSAQSVNARWEIAEATAGGSFVGLIIDYNGASTGGSFAPLSAVIAHCNGTSVDASIGAASGTVVTGGPFTSFSPFGITSNVSILPIKLIQFKAAKQSNTALINWIATNEENLAYYELWHSIDGIQYLPIKIFNITNGNYSFLYQTPYNGINFYKLKMIEKNGNSYFSNIENVDFGKNSTVKIYPTIATNFLNVRNPTNQNSFYIVNALGKTIMTGKLSENRINITSLSNGLYYLVMDKKQVKFIKY